MAGFFGFRFDYLFTPFANHPGIPIVGLPELVDTAQKLLNRREQMEPALAGLSRTYQIGGQKATARQFLFGDTQAERFEEGLGKIVNAAQSGMFLDAFLMFLNDIFLVEPETSGLTKLSLDAVKQFDISITEFDNAYKDAQAKFPDWEATLTDANKATERFWPTIAEDGVAYNLLFLKKVAAGDLAGLKAQFGAGNWKSEWDALVPGGSLYVIDLSIFSAFPPASVDKLLRFTPATVTLLKQDAGTKALAPIAVKVSGFKTPARVFVRGDGGDSHWIYALQAAKTSVTVYGIWLGHVYHWHIVTAALIKGMTNNLAVNSLVYKILGPQSKFLLEFDNVLLLAWKFIAPPTSFDTKEAFLQLIDAFARGRQFFDDDPTEAIKRLGLKQADFTVVTPWDRYPIVGFYLDLYTAAQEYVGAVVDASFKDDAAVAKSKDLASWMKEAADPKAGNVRGLPTLNTKDNLKRLLTSLIYRVTMHGCTRLRKSLSPTLSYVANYPVALQIKEIPRPGDPIDILKYLPKTGTIGLQTQFYDIFIYSAPYESLIPRAGIETDLYYSTNPKEARNQALLAFRKKVVEIMHRFQPEREQLQQWPRSIET